MFLRAFVQHVFTSAIIFARWKVQKAVNQFTLFYKSKWQVFFKEQKHLCMFSYKPVSVVSQNVWHWAEESFTFHTAAWGWKIFLCHLSQSRKSQLINCPVHEGFLWTMHSGLSKVCFQLYGGGCWSSALRCRCTFICNFFKNTVQTATWLVAVRPFISWCGMCLRCGCLSHRRFLQLQYQHFFGLPGSVCVGEESIFIPWIKNNDDISICSMQLKKHKKLKLLLHFFFIELSTQHLLHFIIEQIKADLL